MAKAIAKIKIKTKQTKSRPKFGYTSTKALELLECARAKNDSLAYKTLSTRHVSHETSATVNSWRGSELTWLIDRLCIIRTGLTGDWDPQTTELVMMQSTRAIKKKFIANKRQSIT